MKQIQNMSLEQGIKWLPELMFFTPMWMVPFIHIFYIQSSLNTVILLIPFPIQFTFPQLRLSQSTSKSFQTYFPCLLISSLMLPAFAFWGYESQQRESLNNFQYSKVAIRRDCWLSKRSSLSPTCLGSDNLISPFSPSFMKTTCIYSTS